MAVVAFQEERVLFGPDVPPETHRRLQTAVAARANPAEAERLFLETVRADPECLPARFALYKFYFNTLQLVKAESAALDALAEAARQAGFAAEWPLLSTSNLEESLERAGNPPAHFFRYTLKALAFIKLRRGLHSEAKTLLDQLERIDPDDTAGGSVIRALANSFEDDDG